MSVPAVTQFAALGGIDDHSAARRRHFNSLLLNTGDTCARSGPDRTGLTAAGRSCDVTSL